MILLDPYKLNEVIIMNTRKSLTNIGLKCVASMIVEYLTDNSLSDIDDLIQEKTQLRSQVSDMGLNTIGDKWVVIENESGHNSLAWTDFKIIPDSTINKEYECISIKDFTDHNIKTLDGEDKRDQKENKFIENTELKINKPYSRQHLALQNIINDFNDDENIVIISYNRIKISEKNDVSCIRVGLYKKLEL